VPLVLVPLVGFGLLLAWIVLFGMHRTTNDWLVTLLTRLAHPQGSFITRAALKVVSLAAGGVLWIVNQVDHAVSKAASHASAAVAHWFHGIAAWLTHVFTAAEDFALDVAHGFERLVEHTIPREIRAATRPLWRGIDALEHDLSRLIARLRAFERGIDRLITTRILPAIRAAEHAIAVTIPRELGHIRSRVGQLEHDLTHPSRAWLKRLAASLWGVALFGLLIRTLARRFPWLFCRKVSGVGRRLCGLDQGLLDSLLMDTVLIAGTISVVEFAKDLQAIEKPAVDLMAGFIREL
jgi:hypothetical protein